MFERFTTPARRVLFTARMMATEAGRTLIEPGDLVLGVLFQDRSGAIDEDQKAVLLAALATTAVKAAAPPAEAATIPFSGATLEALAATGRIADSHGHRWIRPEHLLEGVAADASSGAALALIAAGIDPAALSKHAVDAVPDAQIEPPVPRAPIH